MGRHSHKKHAGGGSQQKKKHASHSGSKRKRQTEREQAEHNDSLVHQEDADIQRTGWRQQDYQHAAQLKLRDDAIVAQSGAPDAAASSSSAAAAIAPAPAASSSAPSPPPRIGSRKKRARTPAWMLEPGEVALSSVSSAAAAGAASAAAASSSAPALAAGSSGLTSSCWNSLPRDCLLHVFSFFDLHAIVRLTGCSHFWYACLRKGLLARVLEHSWRLLRQRKQPLPSLLPALHHPAATPLMGGDDTRRLSDIISPANDSTPAVAAAMSLDPDDEAPIVRASPPPLLPPASPALSALQAPSVVLAALQRQHSGGGAAGPTAASMSTPGGAFSSSSTLFKASLLHLRSLYFGQKQLQYALHSNPLFQHLSVIYHISACQEQVLLEIRRLHVALYRGAHRGKWPRSTKAEEGAAAAVATASSSFACANDSSSAAAAAVALPAHPKDLMPLHFDLDAASHHRLAFLNELQQSQKHLYELLHERPVHVYYGFDGSSLLLVQLRQLRTRVEEQLETLLRQATKQGHKGRYHNAAASHPTTNLQQLQDTHHPDIALVQPADLPGQFVQQSAGKLLMPSLFSATDASHVAAIVRRMARLAAVWGKFLHSGVSAQLVIEEAEARARALAERHAMEDETAAGTSGATVTTAAAAAAAAPKLPGASALEREWDACALLWRSQHVRLQRLHLFWRSFAQLLQDRDRTALLNSIVQSAQPRTGAPDATVATAVAADENEDDLLIGLKNSNQTARPSHS